MTHHTKKDSTGRDDVNGPWTGRIFVLFALAPLLLSQLSCGSGVGDKGIKVTHTGGSYTITVEATQVTSSSIRLSITASFNALGTPFWREDIFQNLAHFDLQSNTPSFYTDTNVAPGMTYCYGAGGNYFMIGDVHSNRECVTTPA